MATLTVDTEEISDSSDNTEASEKTWKAGTLTYTGTGLVVLFCWLLWGDFAWSMKDRAVGPSATLLFRSFISSDLLYTLIIISFPNFTNIFLCPIISYISDRHRGRWGRRIPFLLFTTPFIVGGVIGLGFTPMLGEWLYHTFSSADGLSLNICKLIMFSVFWISLDFGTSLAGALSGALINDVVPAGLLGRFFALFRAVSLIAGMLFNYFLVGKIETHYLYIFAGVGILYGVGLLSLCLKVKEGEYPPVEPVTAGEGVHKIFNPIFTYFRQSFSVSYYRWVIMALVFVGLAAAPYNMFAILYVKSIKLDMQVYGELIALTYAVSLILSYLLGMLADRFHPLRTSIVGMFAYLFTMLGGWFLVDGNTSFGVFLVLHGVASGCYFTLSASLGARLFPRTLFAQFGSAGAMIAAIANVLLAPFLGWLLDILNNDYKYIFLFGAITTTLGIISLLRVYCFYIRFGGDKNYCPPDPGK